MNLHRHSWTRWVPYENWYDNSFGDWVPYTSLIRRCRKCGQIKTKDLCGISDPIDKTAVQAVMNAPYEYEARKPPRRASAERDAGPA